VSQSRSLTFTPTLREFRHDTFNTIPFQFPTHLEFQWLAPVEPLVFGLPLSDCRKGKEEDAMIIIALFGGLVLGGAAFGLLKRLGQSSNSTELHIV
jgi:hypothetical protein